MAGRRGPGHSTGGHVGPVNAVHGSRLILLLLLLLLCVELLLLLIEYLLLLSDLLLLFNPLPVNLLLL